MARVTVAEARATDILEAMDDVGRVGGLSRRAFGLYARQIAGGFSITLRDAAGRLCLVAGLYPDGEDAEAWFAVGPGLATALRPTLRQAHAVLEATGAACAPLTCRAYIHPRSVAGPRLAAWLGFSPAGVTDTALGPLETWARRFA